ncbi:MAG: ABC transporter permease [Actinomycetota bacterium]
MLFFVIRRTAFAAVLLLVISAFTFWIFSALPADPAALTCGKNCRPEVIEANRERLGYDRPILEQYGSYMKGIFAGRDYGEEGAAIHCSAPSLGYSYDRHECVTTLIAKTLPVTASLAFGAFVLWMFIGIGLGTMAALKRGRWPDRLATGFSVIGVSLPTFFLGLIFTMVFIIWTGLLPFPQYAGITENPGKWFSALILPWFVLAIVSAATYVRMTRNGMLEVMNEEFVRLGIAKGLPRRRLIVKYVMRAALIPIVTIAGLDFAFLLGGALVTESIFNLPGLGKLTLAAVVNSDLPILVATTLVAAVFIVVANAVVDVLYGYLDPRVRVK